MRFDKQDEDGPILDEIELHNNLKISGKSTEFDIDNENFRCQLEHKTINQETKDSVWSFDKINSMTILFISLRK